jgi:hypothetical protein
VNFENQIADDDVNRAYSKFETSFIEIIDKHTNKKEEASSISCTLYFQNSQTVDHLKKFHD